MAFDPEQASAVLTAADPVMGALIASLGPMHRDQRMRGETFPVLLRAIVYQQLSGKAAVTIHGRVLALFGERQPAAAALAG
ncbi:MAG: DNA-3-methyladenine glycosylase 2 family protein, partial [Salinisphaera sp.]|nr:DNA-3-methyladenine glycosylase 2 family protein [Salinisphaera sp.]